MARLLATSKEIQTMTGMAPRTVTIERSVAPVAAGSDLSTVIGPVPFAGTVTAVTFTPVSTLTGANTDTRSVALKNTGQAGAGTTSVASAAFVSGTNATGCDETATTLTATAADLVVAAGDTLKWTSTHSGSTGLADPGGLVRVTVARS